MKVTWIGHASLLIEGSIRIMVDPFIEANPSATVKKEDIPRLDVIAITHDHEDHISDAFDLAKRDNAVVVAMHEIAVKAGEQGITAEGMNIGGTVEVKGAKFTMVLAVHSSYSGHPCGYVITLDGKRIYHAGDTGLTRDMEIIGELYTPDISFLPIGSRYTMDIVQAAKAVEYTKTKKVVPIHYNTWPPIQAAPEEFKKLVGNKAEVIILKPGQSYEL
ncbi:MAG TPA: metal-dependent hydrolase [candidate division WOR-3 bacterium]|uniref:UPF0173 metal-dependent hydrolase ENL19_03285 n=1 Tax=candidate division WOR-3 bacterium TaxID=2052148 RepID=A0A7C5HJW3_UNCW3|nr:metal-dependent hydrolase [Candidatus Aminicenantes bacterium]HHE05069.1 metal-dependent hydrolase [candidate division WOR-3 bacterium]